LLIEEFSHLAFANASTTLVHHGLDAIPGCSRCPA
jgi:hypothetical protein